MPDRAGSDTPTQSLPVIAATRPNAKVTHPCEVPVRERADTADSGASSVGGGDSCCAPLSREASWHRAAARARWLAWASLAWMGAEGGLGLIAGIRAESVSLIGWALGSVIEGLASLIVIWRFTGTRTVSESAEAHARRAVAVSFFLLAPYIAVQAVRDLLSAHPSQSSTLGVAVTALSLIVMPLLGVAKQRLGAQLDSGATRGEGVQNLMCAAQAAAVLLGLAVTAVAGWSWVDPAIALLIAGWAIYEGAQAWRGEDCC